ncbi:MAG: APC family permease [Candidatus Micrarchaeia archaeon]
MAEQKISVKVATAVSLGAIIGAGIFVLSGTAIALSGVASLFAFMLVGILAVIVAMEIGELSSMFPKAKGSVFSFVYEAFGSELGFITGMLLYFSFSSSISVIALGFGSYFQSLFGSYFPSIAVAIALILVLSFVNILGIKKATKADFGLVLIKISILIIFIAFAFFYALSGHFTPSNFATPSSMFSIGAIFAASIAVFFAYSGFQVVSTLTSSMDSGRSAAKAILYSVIISMALYVIVDMSLMLLAPVSVYKISADPLSVALKFSHSPSFMLVLIDIGAMIATTSASLAMILGSSRILYQISSNRLAPKIFRGYNARTDVSVNNVIITMIIAITMLFSGNVYIIAAISNFGLLFSYIMAGLSLMHFRRAKLSGTFKIPLYPYLTVISIIMLIIFIYGMPKEALVLGLGMLISLFVVYYFLRELKNKKPVKIYLFR